MVVYLVYICITSKNFENSETALKFDRMDVHCKIYWGIKLSIKILECVKFN